MDASIVAELQTTAALLEDRAARLDASADVLATRFATATWAGPAADRFRATIVERRNEMRVGADALRTAAQSMRLLSGGAS